MTSRLGVDLRDLGPRPDGNDNQKDKPDQDQREHCAHPPVPASARGTAPGRGAANLRSSRGCRLGSRAFLPCRLPSRAWAGRPRSCRAGLHRHREAWLRRSRLPRAGVGATERRAATRRVLRRPRARRVAVVRAGWRSPGRSAGADHPSGVGVRFIPSILRLGGVPVESLGGVRVESLGGVRVRLWLRPPPRARGEQPVVGRAVLLLVVGHAAASGRQFSRVDLARSPRAVCSTHPAEQGDSCLETVASTSTVAVVLTARGESQTAKRRVT
jgi:hypothetical protein